MFYHKYGKSFLCIGVLIALVFTATCSLQPVSSIRIKAEPKVFLPLGSKSIGEDEVFKKVENLVPKNGRLYRYQSGQDDKLRYLAYYPLETPFNPDIDSYFNGDPLGNGGSGNNKLLSRRFDTEISIPKINESKSIAINAVDINGKLLEKFNSGSSLSVPVGSVSGEHSLPPVNINFQGFETITFDTESCLEISATPNSGSYKITKAMMKSNGKTIPGNIPESGYNVKFPLDDKTISKTIELTLTVKDMSGVSNLGVSRTLHGTIKRATGVNADLDITPAPGSVAMPLPEDFCSATIGTGELKLSMDEPKGWSDITIEEQTKITQAGPGGLSINPGSFQPLGTPVPLANKTLNNQPTLTYEPKLKVKLANATYTYQENLSVNFNFSVDTFSSITMKNKDAFKAKTVEKDVPEGIKSWVKQIQFKDTASVKIKLKNGLPAGNVPAGNDITIKLSSDCFKIDSAPGHMLIHGESESDKEYKFNNGTDLVLDINNTDPGAQNIDKFDLTSQVLLPGYDEHDDTFTVQNIATGSTIQFSGAVDVNPDWEKIILKAKTDQKSSFPQDGSMDLSGLTEKLKDAGIKLEEMPVYFYAGSASSLLEDQTMDIKLTAHYGAATPKVLVNESAVKLRGLPADFPRDAKIFTGNIPKPALCIKNKQDDDIDSFTDIINEYPDNLRLDFELTMSQIVIDRDRYDNSENKNAKVSIDLLIELPVGFKVKNDREISLKKLFGMDMSGTDLFRRNGPNDKPLGNDLISDAFRSINVNINFKNGMNRSPNFILRFKDGSDKPVKDDSGKAIEESVAITGEKTIKLTTENWKKLVKTYPVSPEFLLELRAGSYSLMNNFELGASLTVLAETNVDYTYNRK